MHTHVFGRIRGWLILAVSLVLIAALLAISLPQPVQAATTCRLYYTVKEGDTTPRISHLFNLKWREIARANGLKTTYRPEVGERLCIPTTDGAITAVTPKFKFTTSSINNLISVTISGLSEKATYVVKVRDAYSSVGGWHRLGQLKVKPRKSVTTYYTLPKVLRGSIMLQICLKDQTSDELFCRTVYHVYK